MHEFSIAQALMEQVVKHAPPLALTREVEVRVGALRGIDPEALRMAWQAVTYETSLAGAQLNLEILPWTIACPKCGRTWQSKVPFVTCECGNTSPEPNGTDELDLISITVDQDDEGIDT